MEQSYLFDERLAMSQGISKQKNVGEILKNNIPGILNVHQSGLENDKNGVDWWAEHCAGKHLGIDCKIRDVDFKEKYGDKCDDLALETWSVMYKNENDEYIGIKIGWTRDENKRTDYILWLWQDTGRWCLIPFCLLCKIYCENWELWKREYKTEQQFTPTNDGGYYSECTFVPRKIIWREIYNKFGGNS